jgi:hypothetical protein
MIRLDCSGIHFGSQLDEKHLLHWAREIPCVVRWEHDTLLVRSRRMAVAERFTQASTCTLISGEGDKLVIDISDVGGGAYDGFLWDRDTENSRATTQPCHPRSLEFSFPGAAAPAR